MEKQLTHTSPRTGLVYEATLNTQLYTRYEITLDGKWVSFCLEADQLEGQVAHYEGVPDGWYCLPRD